MHKPSSLRWRLLWNLALLLVLLMLASGMSAYWNGREAADTAYDRTLLASARTIAAGLTQVDGTLSANVPYVALDTFAYDSAGRIYYQVNDFDQKLISGYENLPGPPPGTPRTDDYPALARFYNAMYQGQPVRVVSLLKAVSEPNMNGMAEIRVAETDEARVAMARSLMADTLLRLGMLAIGALLLVWFAVSAALRPLERLRTAVEERSLMTCGHCRWWRFRMSSARWCVPSITSQSACAGSSSARRSLLLTLPTNCVRRWLRSRLVWSWACAPKNRPRGAAPWKAPPKAPTA